MPQRVTLNIAKELGKVMYEVNCRFRSYPREEQLDVSSQEA